MLRLLVILILALLLVGAVAGITTYFNKTHQAIKVGVVSPTPEIQTKIITVTPLPSGSPNASASPQGASTPVVAATKFYSSYINCARQNGSNCSYKDSPYVDSVTLSSNLSAKNSTSESPILCAQNTPDTFQVVSPKTSGDSSTVGVKEVFGSTSNTSTIKLVSVDLMLENGDWKITDITCPAQ